MKFIFYIISIIPSKLERIILSPDKHHKHTQQLIKKLQTPEGFLWNAEDSERCFLPFYKSKPFAHC